jgi:glycosyltransferase involved in cell wall biosynthesis
MECDWLAGLDRDLISDGLRGADAIVGCSSYITDAIRQRFPQHAAKCRTIYNGVDVSAFAPRRECAESGGGPRIIFVNRISPEKGLHVLLDAFAEVIAQRPDVTLEIVGPDDPIPLEAVTSLKDNIVVRRLAGLYHGNYAERMRKRVHENADLRNRVTFTGPAPHSRVAERIAQADILVQPSIFDEPFGIAIVEAMAAGLPVVGSSAGGIPELIVDERTGILVDRDNPSALATALLRLVNNPILAKTMGVAGRRRAQQQFTWEQIIDDLKSCYFEPSYHLAKAGEAILPLSHHYDEV